MITLCCSLALAAPGARLDVRHDVRLDLDLEVTLLGTPKTVHIHQQQQQRYQVTQLEQGIEVAWTKNQHTVDQPGHQHDRALPVVGHRYRSHPTPTRLDGDITPEEAEIVDQVHTFEMLDAVAAMLPPQLEVGTTVDAGPLFAGILDPAPGEPKLESGSLAVRDVRPDQVVVAVTLSLSSDGLDARGAQVHSQLALSGTLLLDPETRWARRFEVSGPLTVHATRTDLDTRGTGQFHSLTVLERP